LYKRGLAVADFMKKRLLVVDDDESFSFFCETVFSANGWEVLLSASLEEAEAVLRKQQLPIDSALIDFRIFPKEGHEIAQALTHDFPGLLSADKISIVSNYSLDSEQAQKTREAGYRFQQKPGDLRSYLKLVNPA
jgi:DNA-binding NtrC family response regulator